VAIRPSAFLRHRCEILAEIRGTSLSIVYAIVARYPLLVLHFFYAEVREAVMSELPGGDVRLVGEQILPAGGASHSEGASSLLSVGCRRHEP
jgi:hypothetical protein